MNVNEYSYITHHNLNISRLRLKTCTAIKANELCEFRFKLIDTFGPYNTGYFKAKKFLTIFYSFNVTNRRLTFGILVRVYKYIHYIGRCNALFNT